MNFEPTVEEIVEIGQTVDQEMKNIGDINDITQPLPNPDQLEQLKKLLDTLPREHTAQLFANLINGNNKMNPNNNSFSGISEDEIRKYKFRQGLKQKQQARMSKNGRQAAQAKYTKKMEEKQKTENTEKIETTEKTEN